MKVEGINAVLGIFSIESIRIKTIQIAYTIHIIQNRATIHFG